MSEASGAEAGALRKELERQWLAILGRESEDAVANDENFFEAGGQSLETIALYASITEFFGETMTYADFLDVIADGDFGGLCRSVITKTEATASITGPVSKSQTLDISTGPGGYDDLSAGPDADPLDTSLSEGLIRIGDRISMLASEHPDDTAIILVGPKGRERKYSWATLEAQANAAARVLRDRGAAGGVTLIALPNGIEHIVATIASWKLGGLVVPVNPALPEGRITELRDMIPEAVVVGNLPGALAPTELLKSGHDSPFPSMGTPRSAALTGGSTGRSRVVLRRAPWVYDMNNLRPAGYDVPGMRPGQIQLVALPMFHGGFIELHNGLALGHTVVVMENFSPRSFLRLIQEHRVNFVSLVPTLMRTIISVEDVNQFDLSSVEAVYHGSGPCPEYVKRRWIELVGAHRLYEIYGAAESIGFLLIRGDEWLNHPGSVGRPQPDKGADGQAVDVRILDDIGDEVACGEIGQVYLKSAEPRQPTYVGGGRKLREHAGFLSVGDLGFRDSDGYIYLVDRRSDVINVGGANIYPTQVENILLECDGVGDVVVVGRLHDILGAQPHAIVVRSRPNLSETDLVEFCHERMELEMIPKSFEFVAALPRDAAGKIRRSGLSTPNE
ncbi:AMP-binding protein [Streptomyces sp. NPDC005402]|uniref:class I adenylate-forming enzyme family protein n=1 Tax=Streptomyces sp. NPDC005402 TaxID=3155338 RepID=UPI0033A32E70